MVVPKYHDIATDVAHNTSTQHHVAPNHDPAPDLVHEHHHGHLQHDESGETGREIESVYSKDTALEKSSIPYHAHHDRDLPQRHPSDKGPGSIEAIDVEKIATHSPPSEEESPQPGKLLAFYTRYRIYFHLFLWLFFTG